MNMTNQLSEFDMAEHLASEEDIAEYIRQVLEDGLLLGILQKQGACPK